MLVRIQLCPLCSSFGNASKVGVLRAQADRKVYRKPRLSRYGFLSYTAFLFGGELCPFAYIKAGLLPLSDQRKRRGFGNLFY